MESARDHQHLHQLQQQQQHDEAISRHSTTATTTRRRFVTQAQKTKKQHEIQDKRIRPTTTTSSVLGLQCPPSPSSAEMNDITTMQFLQLLPSSSSCSTSELNNNGSTLPSQPPSSLIRLPHQRLAKSRPSGPANHLHPILQHHRLKIPSRQSHKAATTIANKLSKNSLAKFLTTMGATTTTALLLLLVLTTLINPCMSQQPEDDYFQQQPSSSSSSSSTYQQQQRDYINYNQEQPGGGNRNGPAPAAGAGATQPSPAYFINGLATSLRKINSTLLTYKSLAEPFLLQFRTDCPYGNLITNARFLIGINQRGNLTYSVIHRNGQQISETPFRHVADGQWHSLLFNGSRISLVTPTTTTTSGSADDPSAASQDPTSSDRENSIATDLQGGGSAAADRLLAGTQENNKMLVNLLNIPPRHQELTFFDGFVGCTKLTSTSGVPIVSSGYAEYSQYQNEYQDSSPSSSGSGSSSGVSSNVGNYFQLETSNPYGPCSDTAMDLSQLHSCPNPTTFVLCARCQNGAKCVVTEGGTSSSEYGTGPDEEATEYSDEGHNRSDLLNNPANACECPIEGGGGGGGGGVLFAGKYCENLISATETLNNLTTILDNANSDTIQELLLSSNDSPIQMGGSNATLVASTASSAEEHMPAVEQEKLGPSTIRPLIGRSNENFTTSSGSGSTTTAGPTTPSAPTQERSTAAAPDHHGPSTPTTTTTPSSAPQDPVLACPCEHGGVCLRSAAASSSSSSSSTATSSAEQGSSSASSSAAGGFTCSCEGTGYYGERCEIENTFCRKNPCMHGICQPKGDSYQCYCLPGFAGENCNINFDECLSNPCLNGATCLDEINKFRCQCAPGFKGLRCEEEINECESHPCQNGGSCFDAIANYSCECVPGFTGHSCEINIDECAPEPCLNGGLCTDLINTFSCNCSDTGFEGFFCDREINDCLGDPCQNDGLCEDGFKSYSCNCHDGYEGPDCQYDIEECSNPDPCHNNGTCLEKSNKGLYNSPPSEGPPKHFQGNFSYSNAAGYDCVCIPGYTGKNCEVDIDECAGSPCGINGKCIDGQNSFTCSCHAGYEGPLCESEINECLASPCVRGTCIDKLADFECKCPEGYGAKNCSVELIGCNSVQCFNGGSCTPSYIGNKHGFECHCLPGYAGTLCDRSTTLSFDGTGYAEINTDDEEFRRRYAMSFRFRTTLSEVLIAIGQGSTYFMLTLSGGKLNLQSSLLNNLNGISSGSNVSNAEWHHVWVVINETHIALAVNLEQTIHPIQFEPEQPVETGFNTTVLGGATPGLSSLRPNLPFFVGCIQDIKINDKKIIPGVENESVKIQYNTSVVKIGCKRTEQCFPNPCENGGSCSDLWQDFKCNCPRPYLGERCESQYIAATFGYENTNLSIAVVHIPLEVGKKFEKSFEISMFVRTREQRGTIFLLTNERKENSLFIEAYVEEDGQLGVLAKLDEAKEETYKVGGLAINDGEPHLISFQKEKTLVKINVNGTEHFRKSLPSKPTALFNPDIMYIGGIPTAADTARSSNRSESGRTLPTSTTATVIAPSTTGSPSTTTTTTVVPKPVANSATGGPLAEEGNSSASNTNDLSSSVTANPAGPPGSTTSTTTTTTTTLTPSSTSIGPNPSSGRTQRSIGSSINRMEPFKGAIQDVRVSFSEVSSGHNAASNKYVVEFFQLTQVNSSYLMGEPLGQVQLIGQVEKGVKSDDTCSIDPCLNEGVCQITWNDFVCICPSAFDGKRCDHLLPCAIVSCPEGSTCSNIQSGSGFECITEVAFDGEGKGVLPHYQFRSVISLENLTFNNISLRYRSQRGGSLLHIDDGAERSIKIGIEQTATAHNQLGTSTATESAMANTAAAAAAASSSSAAPYIVVQINGNRTVERMPKALSGEWHEIKLALDLESNTFVLFFDGITRTNPTTISPIRPGESGGGGGGGGSAGGGGANGGGGGSGNELSGSTTLPTHHQATVTLTSLSVPPDFVKSIVTSPTATIIVGSFIQSGERNSYNYHSGGGAAASSRSTEHFHSESLHDDFFRGCLSDVYIGSYRLPFVFPSQLLAINPENQTIVETTAPAAFYMEEQTTSMAAPGTGLHLGCILCYDKECQNEGVCENPIETFDCECGTGFNGTFCEININECELNDCEFGSTCLDQIANYTCACQPGYTGWLCDTEVNECDPNPCQNHGVCHDEIGSYNCSCPNDYTGINCDRRKQSSCNDGPCENGAVCVNTPKQADGTFFNCDCSPAFTGKTCAKMIDHCENVTCLNAGKCVRKKSGLGADCVCVPGWGGPRCEKDINECLSSPCHNNGHCIDLLNRFECDCVGTGFQGPTCEEDIDECMRDIHRSPPICPRNSTCKNTIGNYSCECHEDYCGPACNVPNPCRAFEIEEEEACFNGGVCLCNVDDPFYRCDCLAPYRGPFCNETNPGIGEEQTSGNINIVYIIAPILAALLIGLIIAAIMLVRVAKKKRATRGVYSPSQQEYCNPRVELDNVLKPPPEERLI